MKTAKQLLIDALKHEGADGLCLVLTPGEVDCGCGFDDFVPCYGDCTMRARRQALQPISPYGEAMSEDILERAKALWFPIPRFDEHRLIMCELIDEVVRQRSLNPFGVDVSVAIRIRDDLILYGNGANTEVMRQLRSENDRLRTPNATDDWGNPLVLSVSGGTYKEDGITAKDARIKELEAEVERLQRLMDVVENTSMLRSNRLEEQIEALVIQKSAKAARIKELEALNESLMENGNDLRDRAQKAEEQLKEIEEGGDCLTVAYLLGGNKKAAENKVLIAYVKRLEAAFLESEAENQFHQDYGESDWEIHPDEEFDDHHGRNWYREEAREALERIKELEAEVDGMDENLVRGGDEG